MRTDININVAKIDDIDNLIKVYSEWSKFKNILPEELIIVDTYDDLIKYFDGSNKTRKYFIATDKNNSPLGACYADISFLSLKNIRLGDMMVLEKYRKRGVGSRLVEEIIKFAINNECKKIWLWTQKELGSAIKLYEKNGFILEGVIKNQFCNKDALLYGLILSCND
ncbi:MAG: GNAT family N-acetyltransferase [Candidatus Moraniibacteriota bacterium]